MKPTLIFLHGALGARSQMAPLAEQLSDFECIVFDFPGHGGSPMPIELFSMELLARHLKEKILAINLQAVHIIGYSMGGYVAAQLAISDPEGIKSIFTLGTKWAWSPEIAQKEVSMLDPATIEQKVPHFAQQLKARHQPVDWKLVLSKTAGLMLALGEKHLTTEDFRRIHQPVMVTLGNADAMVTREETEAVVQALPNGQMRIIPDTPHPIEKANLARVVAAIAEHIPASANCE